VIGAGIAGLAAMRHLQTLGRGVNVIVLEVSGSISSAARTATCCWCTRYVANARAMLLVHKAGARYVASANVCCQCTWYVACAHGMLLIDTCCYTHKHKLTRGILHTGAADIY
jgi:glycine/D-amino acid oxidase-like deaminating enzyme